MTAPYNKINYSLSSFFASSAGASVVSVVVSAASSTVSVASAGVSTPLKHLGTEFLSF